MSLLLNTLFELLLILFLNYISSIFKDDKYIINTMLIDIFIYITYKFIVKGFLNNYFDGDKNNIDIIVKNIVKKLYLVFFKILLIYIVLNIQPTLITLLITAIFNFVMIVISMSIDKMLYIFDIGDILSLLII